RTGILAFYFFRVSQTIHKAIRLYPPTYPLPHKVRFGCHTGLREMEVKRLHGETSLRIVIEKD
ncbi:MAG: hypothetical protein KDK54_17205, partial [Leptospiraceae bacterium]|nr:hypothetical protein [Leptospiraceae bacterium]